MGQYFKIVNPNKRQFLHAGRFYENIKASGLMYGNHAVAVALLVCNSEGVRHEYGPLAGSWCGDPVIAAGDYGPPDVLGIKTSTEQDPHRNLYQMAYEEFDDISVGAIAMLCEGREGFAREIVERAQSHNANCLLADLGDIVFSIKCPPLEMALNEVFGDTWTKAYKLARARR